MVVHLLWIINKSGQLIFNQNFTPREQCGEIGLSSDRQMTVASVMYGLHSMSRQISPTPKDVLECEGMNLVETAEHNIHMFETATLLKFVVITDPNTLQADVLFNDIYAAYVDYVLKNPFYPLDDAGIGQPIRIGAFKAVVEQAVARFNDPVPGRR